MSMYTARTPKFAACSAPIFVINPVKGDNRWKANQSRGDNKPRLLYIRMKYPAAFAVGYFISAILASV